MSTTIQVSLISHSSSALSKLQNQLDGETEYTISRVLLNEEEFYPQNKLTSNSDVMVIALTDSWEKVFRAIADNANDRTAAVVVIGPENEAGIIKEAFRSGAVDYLEHDCDKESIIQSIKRASTIKRPVNGDVTSDLTVLVTPKGGAGSTTLVVNLAHAIAAVDTQKKVLAVDLDFQYGNLPIFFNEQPSTRLANAFLHDEQIDSTILNACIGQRESNPNILATYSDQVISPWDFDIEQISGLFNLISTQYSHVIVDLPRSIDPMTFYALEHAHKICVIVQQTISDMRIANQYIRLLLDQGISSDSIYIVINRYEKRNTIREQDFAAAFQGYKIFNIPNDYKRVTAASDNTVAFIDRWKSAPITKSLRELSEGIWPEIASPIKSLFSAVRSAGKAA